MQIELDGVSYEVPKAGKEHKDLSIKLKSEIYVIELKRAGGGHDEPVVYDHDKREVIGRLSNEEIVMYEAQVGSFLNSIITGCVQDKIIKLYQG